MQQKQRVVVLSSNKGYNPLQHNLGNQGILQR
jgi:hypothetical protein